MELRFRLLRYFDVAAVFCLAVLPDLVRSLWVFVESYGTSGYSFSYMHTSLLVRSIKVSVPILCIMFIRRVKWSDYGFQSPRLVRDPLTGLGLVLVCYFTYAVAYNVLTLSVINDASGAERVENMVRGMSPTSWFAAVVMLASSCANGFAEELVMRSYLITRLSQLWGNKVLPVLLTSLLFGAYHTYQGMLGAVSACICGIVLGTYFEKTRRFWPIAVAHAAMDIIPQLVYLGSAE